MESTDSSTSTWKPEGTSLSMLSYRLSVSPAMQKLAE